MMTEEILDVTGLKCPLPILRAKKALAKLQAKDRLIVLATDTGSVDDFNAFCRQTGHILHESSTLPEGVFRFVIEHKGSVK